MVLSYEFEMFGEILKISAEWGVLFEGVVNKDNIESILFENVENVHLVHLRKCHCCLQQLK